MTFVVLATVLAVGLVPDVGSSERRSAEPSMASAERRWLTVPGATGNTVAVDSSTGRAFVLSDGDLRVLDTKAYTDDVATLAGPYGPPVAALGSIFAGRDGAIRRINPSTLLETGSWAAPSLSPEAELTAGDGGIVWRVFTHPSSDVARVYRLDPATGSVTWSEDTLALDGLAAGGSTVVGWQSSPGKVTSFQGAEPGAFVDSGISDLSQLAVSSDGSVVTAVDFENSRAVDLALPGFVPTGDTYDVAGSTIAVATTAGAGGAVAVVSAPDGSNANAKLRVYRRGHSAPVVDINLPSTGFPSGTQLEFSADGKQLFFLIKGMPQYGVLGRLVVAELASEVVTTAEPAVVGSRGGARVVVQASLGTGSSLTVAGQPVSVVVVPGPVQTLGVTHDDLAFTVPALDPGTKLIWLTNALGHATSAGPVHVVDLGPFVNAPWFVRKQVADLTGKRPTPQQFDAKMGLLANGSTAGQVIASIEHDRGQATQSAALIRLYRAVFLRPPDTAGLRYWQGQMTAGTRLVQVAATFAGSGEFERRYGTLSDAAFVDRIYRNVLGRAADPNGRAYWIGRLRAGTSRGLLVAQFSQSGEYVTRSTVDVERIELRLAMLGRTPTEAELAPLRALPLDQVAWQFLNDPGYSTN